MANVRASIQTTKDDEKVNHSVSSDGGLISCLPLRNSPELGMSMIIAMPDDYWNFDALWQLIHRNMAQGRITGKLVRRACGLVLLPETPSRYEPSRFYSVESTCTLTPVQQQQQSTNAGSAAGLGQTRLRAGTGSYVRWACMNLLSDGASLVLLHVA